MPLFCELAKHDLLYKLYFYLDSENASGEKIAWWIYPDSASYQKINAYKLEDLESQGNYLRVCVHGKPAAYNWIKDAQLLSLELIDGKTPVYK